MRGAYFPSVFSKANSVPEALAVHVHVLEENDINFEE